MQMELAGLEVGGAGGGGGGDGGGLPLEPLWMLLALPLQLQEPGGAGTLQKLEDDGPEQPGVMTKVCLSWVLG